MPDRRSSSTQVALRMAAAHVGESCACFSLRKAARAVTQSYDAALRPSGLRVTQFTLLALLLGHGGLEMNELAAASVTDRTTLTRNLALLESRGLVRFVAAADSRVRRAELTDAGRDAVSSALPMWEAAQAELAQRMGGGSFASLRRELTTVIGATTIHSN